MVEEKRGSYDCLGQIIQN